MTGLPAEFVATRQALHAVTEHLLGAASFAAIGKLGLRANESGFATQDLNGVTYTVSGPFLTDGTRSLLLPGSTLRGIADWMSFVPQPRADLDEALVIDTDCAVMIGEWFAGMQQVLAYVFPDEVIQLWPEHFDLATTFREANFGASPGDEHIPEPYVYFGPWGEPFVPLPYSELLKASDPLAAAQGFFSRYRKLLG